LEGGNYREMFLWANVHGCPMSRRTRNMAQSRGRPELDDVEFSDDDDFSDDEED
jgi:hypothetical protein